MTRGRFRARTGLFACLPSIAVRGGSGPQSGRQDVTLPVTRLRLQRFHGLNGADVPRRTRGISDRPAVNQRTAR
jgi:hypothetical protein